MQTKKTFRILQYGVKIFILALVTYFAVMHQLKGVLGAPNAHVFCVFGGLESLYKLVALGGLASWDKFVNINLYIKKIMPATMILLFGSILLTIVLNRAFCGWICPLGTLQTIFDKIARFLKIKKVQVPIKVEKYLNYVKYVFLVTVLYFTWRIGDLVYAAYNPWAAYTHLAAGFEELYTEFLIGSIFLVVALIGSLWIPNNFCRYFCPMGAFLSLFSKISPTKIYRNQDTCIDCKKCDQVCPVQIEISTTPKVSSAQCLSCGDCIAVCPVENTLDYSVHRKLKLRWLVYGITTVVLFFVPVLAAKQADIWKTNFASAQEVLVDDSGMMNPYNIKGSMTLESVSKEFSVPVEAFIERFNLPEDINPRDKLKDIAHPNNLSVHDFREFIAESLQQRNPDLTFEKATTGEGH